MILQHKITLEEIDQVLNTIDQDITNKQRQLKILDLKFTEMKDAKRSNPTKFKELMNSYGVEDSDKALELFNSCRVSLLNNVKQSNQDRNLFVHLKNELNLK